MVLSEEYYREHCVPVLMERFGYRNPHEVPRLVKISLNMGLGEATQNPKLLDQAVEELSLIAGQRAVVTRARKSIAAFKVRAGMPIGCRVTLRRGRMWDFLTKFIHLAIPRIRDFRGLPRRSFDGRGSYTFGVREHIIFPEIDYDKVEKVKGLNVTIVTSAESDEEALVLLEALGFPFRR